MITRDTYIEINLNSIRNNVAKIVDTYKDYKYRVAVIKSDCYGHKGRQVVEAILAGGANYLTVSMFDEAMALREYWDGPISLLVPCPVELIDQCVQNNISVTVPDMDYLKQIAHKPVKVHLRVDVGDDFYNGPKTGEELREYYDYIEHSAASIEAIYMHSYCTEDEAFTEEGFCRFEAMISAIPYENIPMISVPNSLALVNYPKQAYANAFRMGNLMYGIENESMGLADTFYLYSKAISVKCLQPGEAVGYDFCYKAKETSYVAILPLGYGDGFAKSNIGNKVQFGDQCYEIVGVTMDITLVLVDETVKQGQECKLIMGNRHLDAIAAHANSIAEEILCCLNTRIPRLYVEK